ncbi:hypothetical protein GGR52DRAFT_61667 [Hypoxylon sp. FL1284]|nr:hypothetical protein GGR52DRAFT_61667 [Hypoxylon sp. FL1284]
MASSESPKRPRLSLQTKPSSGSSSRSTRSLANADPKSPTAFNTLSNIYVTAIERSTPTQSTPVTAINLHQPLKLQTDPDALRTRKARIETPFTAALPDTPLSADPKSPAQQMDVMFPSTMTSTPPLSAGPVESSGPSKFSFVPTDTSRRGIPLSPAQSRRRVLYGSFGPEKAPYSRNRSLHSILRNSPLPPPSALSPLSPRRQSWRLQEKAARHVGYVSPLEQTITTEKYTRSHIDLLADDASPYTPSPAVEDCDMSLDLALAYTGDEIRDGGETPGPFEEMRRHMNGLSTETPIMSPRPDGVRKRKRKEKKRRWVWTIGQDDDDNDSGAIAALKAATDTSTPKASAAPLLNVPTPARVKAPKLEPSKKARISVETADSGSGSGSGSGSDETSDRMDVDMSDADSKVSSRATTPHSVDLEMKTPTITAPTTAPSTGDGLESADASHPKTDTRGDTPIPPELVSNGQG